MVFSSFEFIFIFLPILLSVSVFFRKSSSILLVILIIASLIFYSYHKLQDCFLMIFSIIINYFIAVHAKQNKNFAIAGILFNVLMIGFFKYAGFIVNSFEYALNVKSSFIAPILPLGISFFTFQQIACMTDIYRKKIAVNHCHFLQYFLLVGFFPHSIAGLLVKFEEIVPQFKNISLSMNNFALGWTIFIIGLFKKVVLADSLAPCANSLFDYVYNGGIPSFCESWAGSISYTLQLYFDFSGYSDMAIGLAKLFNINFPVNFDSPYRSTSIIEFWRRWHITLSNFLKEYLYISLGGNRSGEITKYRNLFITMLIGGIWHGANWNFVIWGIMHGMMLIINHMWIMLMKRIKYNFSNSRVYLFFSWSLTMISILLGWVIFRSNSLSSAIILYKSMFGFYGLSITPSLANILPTLEFLKPIGFFANQIFYFNDFLYYILAGITISIFFPSISDIFFKQDDQNGNVSFRLLQFMKKGRYSLLWAIYVAFLTVCSLCYMLFNKKVEFLYFNF